MRWQVLIVLALLVTGCNYGVGMSWSEIEEVGGLSLGHARRFEDGSLRIPVRCNVAGLDSITVKPRMMNSGLGVAKVEAVVENGLVLITVFAGPGAPAQCTDVMVYHTTGTLRAAYRSPDRSQHDLGAVVVSSASE